MQGDTTEIADGVFMNPFMLAWAGIPVRSAQILQLSRCQKSSSLAAMFREVAHGLGKFQHPDELSGDLAIDYAICVGEPELSSADKIGSVLQPHQDNFTPDASIVIEMFPLEGESWQDMEGRYLESLQQSGFYIQRMNGFRRGHRFGIKRGLDGITYCLRDTADNLECWSFKSSCLLQEEMKYIEDRIGALEDQEKPITPEEEYAQLCSLMRDRVLDPITGCIAVLRPIAHLYTNRDIDRENKDAVFQPTVIPMPKPERNIQRMQRLAKRRFLNFE